MRKVFFIILPPLLSVVVFVAGLLILSKSPGEGALQVTSSPPGKVYLNGKLIGDTPLCKCDQENMIKEGEYIVKIVPNEGNFEQFEQKIRINPSVLTVVDRTFGQGSFSQGSIITLSNIPNKKEVQLSVLSFPDKAQVYLDDNLVGVSPFLLKKITESDHEIKLTRDGYKDKIIRIKAVAGYRLEAIVFMGVNPDLSGSSSATPISTPSPTASPSASKIIILDTPTGFLRVRETDSVSSAQVTTVNPGEKYDLVSEKEGWFEIKLTDGKIGWISSQYSKKE